jgi:adenosylcobinamide kinase/adenosylcobinamide-phosphate guanylyltransferase
MSFPQPVLFVATAEAGDEEMQQRIQAHRKKRPATWKTLEAPFLVGDRIRNETGSIPTVIIDCITLLVNNVFNKHTGPDGELKDSGLIEGDITAEIESLTKCMNEVNASFIVVTNEVGQGLVPASSMSRSYRDILGKTNRMLARNMDEVYMMIAGLPVKIK